MSIITVSRETGSLGDETARLIAGNLGFSILDRSALEKAVDGDVFPDIPVDKFDEHSPSFWENFTSGKDIYLDRLRTAMLQSARDGKLVVLGRGGEFILRGIPGVFRVRLIAGTETRIVRTMEALGCDKRTAEKFCRKNDHDRNGFCRFFFGGHWTDPASYDMTLCTDGLSSRSAADIITGAYKASGAPDAQRGNVLTDRLTAQIIRNRILYAEAIPVDLLEVEVDDGHATVRGTVTVRENAVRCEEAAKSVPGVTAVDAEVYFVNPVMTY